MESPFYLPGNFSGDGPVSWNPNGPDGSLVDLDASYLLGRRVTIGEMYANNMAPPGGWVRGSEGNAIQAQLWNAGQVPPGWRPQPTSQGTASAPPSYGSGTSARRATYSRPSRYPPTTREPQPARSNYSSRATANPSKYSGRSPYQPTTRSTRSSYRSRTTANRAAYSRPSPYVPTTRKARSARLVYRSSATSRNSTNGARGRSLGLILFVAGIVGILVGFHWGESYPADQPYSALGGWMILLGPLMSIVGFMIIRMHRD
jgi:hypothetical protein